MLGPTDIFRTPPHILNLRFGVMLVAQYEAKKERLASGRAAGLDVRVEEAFVAARAWQYQQALGAINSAPDETLAQAVGGMKLGRAVSRRLKAAGLGDRITRASRSIDS
jgi:hypothetical protein